MVKQNNITTLTIFTTFLRGWVQEYIDGYGLVLFQYNTAPLVRARLLLLNLLLRNNTLAPPHFFFVGIDDKEVIP